MKWRPESRASDEQAWAVPEAARLHMQCIRAAPDNATAFRAEPPPGKANENHNIDMPQVRPS